MRLYRYWSMAVLLLALPAMPVAAKLLGESILGGEAIQVNMGERFEIESQVLNETRQLLVRVPRDYQSAKKDYPVLYLLDGKRHFIHGSTAAGILFREDLMPEAIVVAVPNKRRKRNRDVGKGRAKFIEFLDKEVIGFVEKNYRTTGHRTLFGHSSMGFVALDVLANRPDIFDNYIAASPAIDRSDTELLGQLQAMFDSNKASKTLYFTVTDKESEIRGFTEGSEHLAAFLRQQSPGHLSWTYNFIPGQNHMTTPYLTLYEGLSTVFGDKPAS